MKESIIMIQSMTGFGRGSFETTDGKVTIEIRAVNHRYLDVNIKLPRVMLAFESEVKSRVSEVAQRGKIDVFINYEAAKDKAYSVQCNEELAASYLASLRSLSEKLELANDVTALSLSRFPDVLEIVEKDTEESVLRVLLFGALDEALASFRDQRMQEGRRLYDDLTGKLKTLSGYVGEIERRSPQLIREYRERILTRVRELVEEFALDENRIAAEVTLYADKVAVDEEIVRLRSHVKEAEETLASGINVGRKLDFLAQEMNREANTILSKSTDASIASMGIEMKTLIEKIREQVQNIE